MSANPNTRTLGRTATSMIVLVIVAAVAARPEGQGFASGSDGSDGALTLGPDLSNVVFDPFDERWGRVLDSDGDGVYHFTTITIGPGTTLVLRGDKVNHPLYWLASGDVSIRGGLNLDGESAGNFPFDLERRRRLSVPGAGGYAGGANGIPDAFGSISLPATPGEGPGGGTGWASCTVNGRLRCGEGGEFTGNRFLVPLVGGSGGGGGVFRAVENGGAGGGAILIASSTSIFLNGRISANGGSAVGTSGNGSGGAIRLVAPVISGAGVVEVNPPDGSGQMNPIVGSTPGWIRLEGETIADSLRVFSRVSKGKLGHANTLKPASTIRVAAIDGELVAPNPRGSFQVPDVTIGKDTPVSVEIAARGVPPGTPVVLKFYPEVPVDLETIYLPPVTATLKGTLEESTAIVTVAFPFGFSRGFVTAVWGP